MLLVGGRACNYFLPRRKSSTFSPLGCLWLIFSVDASYRWWLFFSRWVEILERNTFVEYRDVQVTRELMSHDPETQEATPRGPQECVPHLCWPWWFDHLYGHLLIYEVWSGQSWEAFLSLMGVTIQEFGNWIEIFSRWTNPPIALLSHRVSVGQIVSNCGLIVLLSLERK